MNFQIQVDILVNSSSTICVYAIRIASANKQDQQEIKQQWNATKQQKIMGKEQ